MSGAFPIRPTEDGYVWEIPAGPGAIIRYTATIRDGTLREIGERIAGEAAADAGFRDEPAPDRRQRLAGRRSGADALNALVA